MKCSDIFCIRIPFEESLYDPGWSINTSTGFLKSLSTPKIKGKRYTWFRSEMLRCKMESLMIKKKKRSETTIIGQKIVARRFYKENKNDSVVSPKTFIYGQIWIWVRSFISEGTGVYCDKVFGLTFFSINLSLLSSAAMLRALPCFINFNITIC